MKMIPLHFLLKKGRHLCNLPRIFGMTKAVRELLKLNSLATYSKEKDRGRYPVHMAASGRHIQVYKEQIQHCPDLEVAGDDEDMTVLHLAVMFNRFHFARCILETTKS